MGMPVVASRLPVIERYFGDDVLLAEPGDAGLDRRRDRRRPRRPDDGARAAPNGAAERLARIEWRQQRDGYLALIDELAGRTPTG